MPKQEKLRSRAGPYARPTARPGLWGRVKQFLFGKPEEPQLGPPQMFERSPIEESSRITERSFDAIGALQTRMEAQLEAQLRAQLDAEAKQEAEAASRIETRIEAEAEAEASLAGRSLREDPNETLERFLATRHGATLSRSEIADALLLIGQSVSQNESLLDLSNLTEASSMEASELSLNQSAFVPVSPMNYFRGPPGRSVRRSLSNSPWTAGNTYPRSGPGAFGTQTPRGAVGSPYRRSRVASSRDGNDGHDSARKFSGAPRGESQLLKEFRRETQRISTASKRAGNNYATSNPPTSAQPTSQSVSDEAETNPAVSSIKMAFEPRAERPSRRSRYIQEAGKESAVVPLNGLFEKSLTNGANGTESGIDKHENGSASQAESHGQVSAAKSSAEPNALPNTGLNGAKETAPTKPRIHFAAKADSPQEIVDGAGVESESESESEEEPKDFDFNIPVSRTPKEMTPAEEAVVAQSQSEFTF